MACESFYLSQVVNRLVTSCQQTCKLQAVSTSCDKSAICDSGNRIGGL